MTQPDSNIDRKPQLNNIERKTFGDNKKPSFRPGGTNSFAGGGANKLNRKNIRHKKGKFSKKGKQAEVSEFDVKVMSVRRVTRVVKGGKRMRFSALVVVGDKQGKIGFAIKKGVDYQDAVAKATKRAKTNLIKVKINEADSLDFTSQTKFKSCEIFLKPAPLGTGVIAGGYLRPVLELAGIKNIYSKIIRSRNKIAGTQAVFEALKRYQLLKDKQNKDV